MRGIYRGEGFIPIEQLDVGVIKPGDTVVLDSVYDFASNIVEYIEFMEKSYKIGFDIICGDINTTHQTGKVFRDICFGLSEFNRNTFGEGRH